jgi:shikimate dehydrogenase
MKILKAALLGRSLGHSISPEVHRAIFDSVRTKCKTDYDMLDYSKIECMDEREFLSHVESGIKEGYRGFNVTFPYKFAASCIGDEPSPLVKLIRSANAILCDPIPRVISTDRNGFRFALEKSDPDLSYEHYALTILGAGGAARAVLHAIMELGWNKITVAARSLEDAQRAVLPYEGVFALDLKEYSRDAAPQFVVQATPVGQRTDQSLLEHFEWSEGDVAVDLVYNPLRTRFLDRAASGGARMLDGLGMLIEQAALSQFFWMTGNEADHSLLNTEEYLAIHASLSKLLIPRWDNFAT